MSTITGLDVWTQINTDSEFLQLPVEAREALKPYIEEMPSILSSMLDEPMAYCSFMKSVFLFLSECRKKGHIEKLIAVVPEDEVSFFSREELQFLMEKSYEITMETATKMSGPENLVRFLNLAGISESEAILQLPLSDEAKAMYQTGKLTIGWLVAHDPMVFFKDIN